MSLLSPLLRLPSRRLLVASASRVSVSNRLSLLFFTRSSTTSSKASRLLPIATQEFHDTHNTKIQFFHDTEQQQHLQEQEQKSSEKLSDDSPTSLSSSPSSPSAPQAVQDGHEWIMKQTGDQISFRNIISVRWWLSKTRSHFFPKDFTRTVRPNYLPWVKWNFLQAVASAAVGVFSTQQMFLAMGLFGATTSGVAAAGAVAGAVNWVIKDGLGQLGGVLFGSIVGNKFDRDPKKWRMIAAVSLDLASLAEILTPLVPKLFLPIASLANIGKNISCLAASATNAGINRSFILKENLADVTGKAVSQAIAASLLGTVIGILFTKFVGTDLMHVLAAFATLSIVHLFSNYRGLQLVAFPTLNTQRAEKLALQFLKTNTILTPYDMSDIEHFIRAHKSPIPVGFRVGVPLNEMVESPSQFHDLRDIFSYEQYILNITAVSSTHSSSSPDDKPSNYQVNLLFLSSAQPHDCILGFLHAMILRIEIAKRFPAPKDEVLELINAAEEYERSQEPGYTKGQIFESDLNHHHKQVKFDWAEDKEIRANRIENLLRKTLIIAKRKHVHFLRLLQEKNWDTKHLHLDGEIVRLVVST